jgi:hypothetical protein
MNAKITNRVEGLTEHVLVKAWARLSQLLGIPLAILALSYAGNALVDLRDGSRANTQTIQLVVLPALASLENARQIAEDRLADRTKDRFSASEASIMETRILYELRKEIARLDREIAAVKVMVQPRG